MYLQSEKNYIITLQSSTYDSAIVVLLVAYILWHAEKEKKTTPSLKYQIHLFKKKVHLLLSVQAD